MVWLFKLLDYLNLIFVRLSNWFFKLTTTFWLIFLFTIMIPNTWQDINGLNSHYSRKTTRYVCTGWLTEESLKNVVLKAEDQEVIISQFHKFLPLRRNK